MNKPYIYQAGYSFDSTQAGKCQIRTRDFRGNVKKLSGWFKDDVAAIKELRKRQKENPVYGCN